MSIPADGRLARDHEVPQKLYKYRAFSPLTLRWLTAAEVYYSDSRDFNDPLDCSPTMHIDVGTPTLEKLYYRLLRRTRTDEFSRSTLCEVRYLGTEVGHCDGDASRQTYHQELLKVRIEALVKDELSSRGVLCFSTNWCSPLMWSHYADQHRGICIEYDTTDISYPNIGPIRYGERRSIKASDVVRWKLENSSDAEKKITDAYFFSKYAEWKYENEWREIGNSVGSTSSRFRISSIFFGYRCDEAVITAIVKLFQDHAMDFFEVRPNDNGFPLSKFPCDVDEIRACGISFPAVLEFEAI